MNFPPPLYANKRIFLVSNNYSVLFEANFGLMPYHKVFELLEPGKLTQ
jgi:hypothetical protein